MYETNLWYYYIRTEYCRKFSQMLRIHETENEGIDFDCFSVSIADSADLKFGKKHFHFIVMLTILFLS